MSVYRFTATFKSDAEDAEPLLITAGPRDQLDWEALSPERAIGSVATGWATGRWRLTDMYSLSHAAAKRQGLFAGDLREWRDTADVTAGHHPKAAEPAESEDQKSEVDDSDEVPTPPAP